MKVAVSIPDPIFADADSLAAQLNTTRSGLYARALGEFVDRHAPDKVTEAMNKALADIDGTPDEFSQEIARRVFDRVEW